MTRKFLGLSSELELKFIMMTGVKRCTYPHGRCRHTVLGLILTSSKLIISTKTVWFSFAFIAFTKTVYGRLHCPESNKVLIFQNEIPCPFKYASKRQGQKKYRESSVKSFKCIVFGVQNYYSSESAASERPVRRLEPLSLCLRSLLLSVK